MPTTTEIREAYQSLVATNNDPAVVREAQALRVQWRDAAQATADLASARTFLTQTPAQIGADQEGLHRVIAEVLAALPTTTDPIVIAFRNRLRALMVHVDSPQWLKDACETLKRTQLVSPVGGVRQYDQEATDPIEVAATAAVAVLGANTTLEQLQAAAATLTRYRELTPDQPTP